MKPTTEETFSVLEFVPYQFALLSSRLSRSLAQTCADHGLSLSEWRLMAVIASGRSMSASDVTERSTMDAVAVHRAVMSLLRRGFIERISVEGDKRIKQLVVTSSGQEAYEAIVPYARELEDTLLSCLSPAESMALRRMLRRLVESRS
jgi:DNA-binding MarR family transcriptional regulator